MADRTVMVVLGANVSGFVANMRTAQQASRNAMGDMARHAAQNREAWETSGRALAGFGAVVVGALGGSIKAAIDWETAWTGVLKTVDGTPAQLAKVEDGLRSLARELPISHAELAGVAEAAGQLGIATDDVVDFTKVMVDLGQTTNLSAEEAATSLARISNIMGTSASDVSRMGATIVELGNNSATTEGEIVAMSTRLAAAGKQAGLSESDIFAFASTLTSVGVEAEAGGTAISKVFTSIADATKDGGEQLSTFASVAGMSTADFKAAFEEDAAGGVAAFIEGMGRMANAGESTTQIFKDLELNDARLKRAVLSTGSASGLLTEQLDMANDAWQANTALLEEAEKRYGTTASKIESAKGSIYDAAITMGETFLPAIAGMADGVSKTVDAFGRLPAPIQATIGVTSALVGGTALLAGGFLLLLPRIVATRAAFQTLATPRLASATRGLGTGLAAVGGQAIAIAATAMAVGALVDKITTGEAALGANALADAIKAVATSGDISKIDDQFDNFGKVLGVNTGKVDDLSGAFDMLLKPSNTDKLTSFVSGFPGLTTYMEKTEERVKSLDASLVSMVQAGDAETVMAFQAELLNMGYSAEEVNRMLPGTVDAMLGVEAASGGAAEGNVLVANSFGEVKEMSEGAAEALQKWREKVIDASTSFISPTGAYQAAIDSSMAWAQAQADATEDAEDSWESFYDGQSVSMAQLLEQQQAQLDAQVNYNANLMTLASQVSSEYLSYLEGLGSEGAPLIAALANALPEELALSDEMYQRGIDNANSLADGMEAAADGREVSVTINADGTLAYQVADEVQYVIGEQQLSEWDLRVDPRTALTEAERTAAGLGATDVPVWAIQADGSYALLSAEAAARVIATNPPEEWDVTADATPAEIEADRAKARIDGQSATIKVGATEAPGLWGAVQGFVDRISSRTATVQVAVGQGGAGGITRATGGSVIGPGTSTSDSIPALLSNGEHVLTAREVQAMGGHSAVERMRAGALSGALPRFATGGAVTRLRDQAQALRREEKAELAHAEWLKRVFGDTSGADAATARARGVAVRAQAAEKAMADEQARLSRLNSARQSMTRSTRRGDVVNQATSSLSGAYSVVDQLWDGAKNTDFSKKQRDGLWAAAAKAEPAMKRLYTQAEKLDKSLANARDKAQELSQIKSSVSGVLGKEFTLGGMLGQQDQYGYDKAVTSKSLVAGARGKAAQIKAFAGKLDRLRKMGLSGLVLQEVAELGTEEGTLVADALIKGGKTDIAALNSAYKSIGSWSDKAGQYVTEGFYKGGYDAAAGLVKGLESQQAAIEKQMLTIAKGMEKALKKALGIKSPSRVMAALGVFAGQGLAEGLESQAGLVAQSADALAVAAQPDLKAGPTTLYTAPSGASSTSLSQADLSSVISAVQAGLAAADVTVNANVDVGRQGSASIVRVGMQERSRNDQGQMKKEVGV